METMFWVICQRANDSEWYSHQIFSLTFVLCLCVSSVCLSVWSLSEALQVHGSEHIPYSYPYSIVARTAPWGEHLPHTHMHAHTHEHTHKCLAVFLTISSCSYSLFSLFFAAAMSLKPLPLSVLMTLTKTHTHKHTHVHTRCWLIDRTKEKIRMEEQQRNWHQREYIGTTMTWMGIENTMNPPAHWWKLPEKLHSIISWQLIRSQLQN